jgi:hypothetical protein
MSDTEVGADADSGVGQGRGVPDRGAPLVATAARWGLCSAALALAFAGMLEGSLLFMHSAESIASYRNALVTAIVLAALLLFWLLRAEESRLARELRTARTGTAALRGMVIGRRQQLPFFARLVSTKLGTAAVLIADGERAAALDLLAAGPLLMQGGRLAKLREIVAADAERAAGGTGALDRCIASLRSRDPVGNREADLYALHVLVKAVLERGDPETGGELAERLDRSQDEDERLYGVWLEAWFDLDAEHEGQEPGAPRAPRGEGELRLAALLARAHGAEKLVEKLEERASAIARPQGQE